MAVDDCNLDAEDLIFDNIEKGYCGISESDHWLSESQKSQLCVPPDPIEDLDWFPTFPDDFISLNDVGLTLPETLSYCFVYDKPNQSPENLTFMDSPVTVIPEPQHENEFKAKQQSKEEEVMNLKDQNHNEMRKKARMKNYHKPKRAVTWMKKRCGHCHAEETPQWRTGPLGPKTLCNACGVRFKSGRLVPEYRPATSPTFDSSRHSNYHRNIMKMRS